MSEDLAEPPELTFKSVGVDIGSSTSHFTISTLTLKKADYSPRTKYEVSERKVIFESEIILTPYIDKDNIDVDSLESFFKSSYDALKLTKDDIHTGAVIATGEAAKKKNAERITQSFSRHMGNFVSATAGHHLEAMLAAHGSGAVNRSRALHIHDEHKDQEPMTIMDVDVGGGTSKMSIVHNGKILRTAAISVGSRLIAFDEGDTIVRIDDPMKVIAKEAGIELEMGSILTLEHKVKLSNVLASCLIEFIQMNLSDLSKQLMLTVPIHFTQHIDELFFSGGVSEYMYGNERRDVGDLGPLLADGILERVKGSTLGIKLAKPDATIRATVVGAAQYTLQISGSTIYVGQPDLLPLKNIPVVTPRINELDALAVKNSVLEACKRYDLETGSPVALSLDVGPIGHDGLHSLSKGIKLAVSSIAKQFPIVLVFKENIGREAGLLLKEKVGSSYPLISIDEVELADFDYIDVGAMTPEEFVPVVVKSLVFHPGSTHEKAEHGTHGHIHP